MNPVGRLESALPVFFAFFTTYGMECHYATWFLVHTFPAFSDTANRTNKSPTNQTLVLPACIFRKTFRQATMYAIMNPVTTRWSQEQIRGFSYFRLLLFAKEAGGASAWRKNMAVFYLDIYRFLARDSKKMMSSFVFGICARWVFAHGRRQREARRTAWAPASACTRGMDRWTGVMVAMVMMI